MLERRQTHEHACPCVPRGLKLILSDCSYFLMKVLLRNPELSHLASLANPSPTLIQISPPLPARPETTGGHHAWWDLCGFWACSFCSSPLLYLLIHLFSPNFPSSEIMCSPFPFLKAVSHWLGTRSQGLSVVVGSGMCAHSWFWWSFELRLLPTLCLTQKKEQGRAWQWGKRFWSLCFLYDWEKFSTEILL